MTHLFSVLLFRNLLLKHILLQFTRIQTLRKITAETRLISEERAALHPRIALLSSANLGYFRHLPEQDTSLRPDQYSNLTIQAIMAFSRFHYFSDPERLFFLQFIS